MRCFPERSEVKEITDLEFLAEGGGGVVYDVQYGGRGAILKVVETSAGAFDAECRAIGDLGPHGVCPELIKVLRGENGIITREGREVGEQAILMSLCPGDDLFKLREGPGPSISLGLKTGAIFYTKLAAKLARAHKMGHFHRDLDPSNVMLENREDDHSWNGEYSNSDAHIIDFGQTGSSSAKIINKQAYINPESRFSQCRDFARGDLYSLGLLIIYLMSEPQKRNKVRLNPSYYQISYYEELKTSIPNADEIFNISEEELFDLWLNGSKQEAKAFFEQKLAQAGHSVSFPEDRSPRGIDMLRKDLSELIANLPEELHPLLKKLLEIDPKLRMGSAHEAAKELAEITVKQIPHLRLEEPFYSLLGRATGM
jgi:serine/threonine protein kinase